MTVAPVRIPRNTAAVRIGPGDALIVVDVQKDFLPGGRLAVPGGDEIVPVANRYLADARRARIPVVATRDWHPDEHVSFERRGGPWPVHCIADTEGATFAAGLVLPPDALIVSKATREDADAYSAFDGTDLDARLRRAGVRRLLVGGLATDYCVLNTVKDARRLGYEVLLLTDAIRAVNVHPDDGRKAEAEMVRAGAVAVRHDQLVR